MGTRAFANRSGVYPAADQVDLSRRKRRHSDRHARGIGRAKNALDEEAPAAIARNDCGAAGAATKNGGFGIEAKVALGHTGAVAGEARLLENRGNVALKVGRLGLGCGQAASKKEGSHGSRECYGM